MRRAPLAPLLLGLALAALGLLPGLAGAATTPPVTATIGGPHALGESLKGTYYLNASGGPGQAPNGTWIGTASYKASLIGVNTTGALVNPSAGVLTNGSTTFVVTAPNATETLTLSVEVTSSAQKVNSTVNVSYSIDVLLPYRVSAELVVGSEPVGAFPITVTLDGVPVGTVSVPALSADAHYPVSFAYATPHLSPGWHAFALSLGQAHGLVSFAGGQDVYSASFYVTGPATSYTVWYVAGAVAFVGAIFIWATRVGARRRGRPKK